MTTVEIHTLETHITRIRLNRPESLNAMTFELVADLHDALDAVAADPICRVVILTGAGRAFCAGLDLKDWGTPPQPGQHRHMPVGASTPTKQIAWSGVASRRGGRARRPVARVRPHHGGLHGLRPAEHQGGLVAQHGGFEPDRGDRSRGPQPEPHAACPGRAGAHGRLPTHDHR